MNIWITTFNGAGKMKSFIFKKYNNFNLNIYYGMDIEIKKK